MTIQTWQMIGAIAAALAAFLGGMYAVVTRPFLASLQGMQSQLDKSHTSLQSQLNSGQQSIQTQLNEIVERLGRIETKLDDHGTRVTRLEERTSPLRRS